MVGYLRISILKVYRMREREIRVERERVIKVEKERVIKAEERERNRESKTIS